MSDVTRGGAGCPLCGFRPVAATVQGDDKVRYLCCGLCALDLLLARPATRGGVSLLVAA